MALPIGLQLYTVRDDCKRDLPATLAAVAKMGYDGVEFAGYHGRSAGELRRMLGDLGLRCCGTHAPLPSLLGDELPRTIEFNRELGNAFLIIPAMPKERRDPIRSLWLDNAKVVTEIAERVRPAGMAVGFHLHGFDFQSAGEQVPWDILAQNTPNDVVLQMDTGNAMSAGQDVLALLRRYPGRARTVHLKGLQLAPGQQPPWVWTFAGEGDVPWREVFAFCESAGASEWYIVEHEVFPTTPLDCSARCLKSLRALM